MAQIIRKLHSKHYHDDERWSPHSFTYFGEAGVDPWFMEPVFNAARNTQENLNSAAYIPKVAARLREDAQFMARAIAFCEENNQAFTADTVARLVRTYLIMIPQDENLNGSPFHPNRIGVYVKPLSRYGTESGFYYKLAEGERPWFMRPVFEAFVAVAREKPGTISKKRDAYDAVLERLQGNEAFVVQAQAFYLENDLPFEDGSVARILDTYCFRLPNDPEFYRGEYGAEKLQAVFESVKPRPYSEEEAARVARHLRIVVPKGNRQSLQTAIPDVIRSMQAHGEPVMSESSLRMIIKTEARIDPAWHRNLATHLDVDRRDEGHEGEGAVATSLTRPAPGPVGSIGSSQPSFRPKK